MFQIFTGNNKPIQTKLIKLERKIPARFIRIDIIKYERRPCLRFEVYGCPNYTKPVTTTTPAVTTTLGTTTPRPTTPCPEFSCNDGACIPNLWVCNGTS